jgi:murein DD-endopeptidase MepM/ murein hydrolase activator NlpD
MHEGVDIPSKVGSNIVAASDGIVVYSGSEIGGYGNITVVAHKNGFFTVYAHAKVNYTKEGQRVYRGQVIAQVGMTGRSSGPHLHFEIRKNGESIDPQGFLASN